MAPFERKKSLKKVDTIRNALWNYGKGILAIFWTLKKFECKLRSRRSRLETDHKSLLEMWNKHLYNNNRINVTIELIQEFDFKIVYIEEKNENGGLLE